MRLIDADALYKDLKQTAKIAREWKEETQDEEIKIRAEQSFGTFVECALRVINAPTIDAEPVRHGEWCGEWERGRYMCSVCKAETDVAEIMGKPAYKFCPNCGAVMSGGAENAVSGE